MEKRLVVQNVLVTWVKIHRVQLHLIQNTISKLRYPLYHTNMVSKVITILYLLFLTLELVSSYKVGVPRVLETESVPELDARSGPIWLSLRSVAHLAPILAVTGLFPPLSVQKYVDIILKEIEFGCRLLTRLKRSMKNTGDTDRIKTLKPYHGLFTFTLLKNF